MNQAIISTALLTTLAFTIPSGPIAVEEVHFATLHSRDPLRHTVSLVDGMFGTAIQDHQLVNVDSELDFGVYTPDGLTAGIQGSQVGQIIDLGTAVELATRYGYQETVGGGQGFASIHFQNGRLMILKDLATQTHQSFTEGNNLLLTPAPTSSLGIPALPGHIYLVKVTDFYETSMLRLAKVKVVSMTPGDQVTITWQSIRT